MVCNCIGGNPCPCQRRVYGGEFWPGKLIAFDNIERFWNLTKAYTGVNFFVITWRGKDGKPHLKMCRDDQ